MEFEFGLEIVNAAIGAVAIVFAVDVVRSVKGGMLENIWKYIGVVGLLFGGMEIISILDETKVFMDSPIDLEVLREIVEFAAIATLAFALMRAKKIFKI